MKVRLTLAEWRQHRGYVNCTDDFLDAAAAVGLRVTDQYHSDIELTAPQREFLERAYNIDYIFPVFKIIVQDKKTVEMTPEESLDFFRKVFENEWEQWTLKGNNDLPESAKESAFAWACWGAGRK